LRWFAYIYFGLTPYQILNDMIISRKLLLLAFVFLCKVAFSQHVQEGYYNDWDYGPHGVYGNLLLTKIQGRTCYKIEKGGPQKVIVRQFNPSGILINVTTVTFLNGILSEFDQANQWGEIYEYRDYQLKEENVFRVTDLVRGKNVFLPCKYALHFYTNELLSEVQYYSFTGQLMEDRNGVAIIQYKRYNDSIRFAERIETSYFDAQRRPVISKSATYHTLKCQFDEHDNKTSESYLGINGEPITIVKSNISSVRFSYDSNNNLIKYECYGLDDKITLNLSGVAWVEREYNQGYLMKETRFDSLGSKVRVFASGDGVSYITYEYDPAGNTVRENYFDQSGKPMNNQSGVQEIASFYSLGNMLTRVSYFDEFGRPCVNRDKFNSTVYVKDDLNRIIQISNFGVDGQPIKTFTEEVFMLKRKYDKYGRVISTSYWADSNTRMPEWGGYYEELTKYDEDGQPIEYINLDADGRPLVANDGSSTKKLVYNADGRLGERQFLHNNKLINRKRGMTKDYSIIKYRYDQSGKEEELTFWGANQKPVNAAVWIGDSISTVHRIAFIYNGNRVVEQKYYKVDDAEPFQIVDCLKNDFVNLSGISTGRKNLN
jgi:hypothetical protein